jgi:hypothetical protein
LRTNSKYNRKIKETDLKSIPQTHTQDSSLSSILRKALIAPFYKIYFIWNELLSWLSYHNMTKRLLRGHPLSGTWRHPEQLCVFKPRKHSPAHSLQRENGCMCNIYYLPHWLKLSVQPYIFHMKWIVIICFLLQGWTLSLSQCGR